MAILFGANAPAASFEKESIPMTYTYKRVISKGKCLFLMGLVALNGGGVGGVSFEKEALEIANASNEKAALYQKEAEALKRESFKKLPPFKKGFSCKGEPFQEGGPQEGSPQEGSPQKRVGCKGGDLPGTIVDEILEEGGALPFKREDKQGEKRAKLYIFVSLSMPKEVIFALGKEAKKYGASLVMQGFKGGDFKETFPFFKEYLEQVQPEQIQSDQVTPGKATPGKVTPTPHGGLLGGGGLLIDPPLFKKFKVTLVPTFVLEEEDRNDRGHDDMVKGVMSLSYALSLMAEKGDLKETAKRLLKRGAHP